MTHERYFRTEGRTPLDGKPLDRQRQTAQTIEHAVWVKHLMDQGGSMVVAGLGTPEEVGLLLEYELGFRGLGEGRIEVRLIRKVS